MTCDGLKLDSNGRKYYDLIVHFFEFPSSPQATLRHAEVSLISRDIFLNGHTGSESAHNLRGSFDETLRTLFGIDLDAFLKTYTFFTDCAATIPKIVGASSSSNRTSYSEKWMECIIHQLNSTMKHVIISCAAAPSLSAGFIIKKDLDAVKGIVATIKHADLNTKLPDGFHLIQV